LKIKPRKIRIPDNGRDISEIGHFGTGDFELTITNLTEFERSKEYIKESYENNGG
jgi:predicted transport protein